MKFLVLGNSPTAKTGYGIQIRQLIQCLREDGHDPACMATYGVQGGVENWHDFRIYGSSFDVHGNDRVHLYAKHWFGDEPGVIIILTDMWVMQNPVLSQFNVVAWTPIDHWTARGAQAGVEQFFAMSGAIPVAMSRFGEQQLQQSNLSPAYVPLSIDTTVFVPTTELKHVESGNVLTSRSFHDIPEDAFLVGMVGMNKGWAKDRKGFNEAFHAFAWFDNEHPEANAYLLVHAESTGAAEGVNLEELAIHAGIRPHKIKFTGGPAQLGYFFTYTDEMMAAMYTSFDVLLAPSHGEGFCVPLIEAQACGTPAIASNFSAQQELVPESCGWLVQGQEEWDPPHHAKYFQPFIFDIADTLNVAFEADRAAMAPACIEHAALYDVRHVYNTYWRPFIATLEAGSAKLELEREPMPAQDAVAVLCPIYKRTENIPTLIDSFQRTTRPGYDATLYLIGDEVHGKYGGDGIETLPRTHGDSCAEGWNAGFEQTSEPFVLCIGDDVIFHDGWLDAARELSADYDVIGTNDTAGAVKNPKVANGSHADHFFVRRAYVNEHGASLEGPGTLASEEYGHWYVDREIIELARARGVFAPCLDSIVEHLHPGYDGDKAARDGDPTYMKAIDTNVEDAETFRERAPIIQQQRIGRMKV